MALGRKKVPSPIGKRVRIPRWVIADAVPVAAAEVRAGGAHAVTPKVELCGRPVVDHGVRPAIEGCSSVLLVEGRGSHSASGPTGLQTGTMAEGRHGSQPPSVTAGSHAHSLKERLRAALAPPFTLLAPVPEGILEWPRAAAPVPA